MPRRRTALSPEWLPPRLAPSPATPPVDVAPGEVWEVTPWVLAPDPAPAPDFPPEDGDLPPTGYEPSPPLDPDPGVDPFEDPFAPGDCSAAT